MTVSILFSPPPELFHSSSVVSVMGIKRTQLTSQYEFREIEEHFLCQAICAQKTPKGPK